MSVYVQQIQISFLFPRRVVEINEITYAKSFINPWYYVYQIAQEMVLWLPLASTEYIYILALSLIIDYALF